MGGGAQYRKNGGSSIRNAIKNPIISINKSWGDMIKDEKRKMIVGLFKKSWTTEDRYKDYGKRYKISYDAASGTTKVVDRPPVLEQDDELINVSNLFRHNAADIYKDYDNTDNMEQWLGRHTDLVDTYVDAVDSIYKEKFG